MIVWLLIAGTSSVFDDLIGLFLLLPMFAVQFSPVYLAHLAFPLNLLDREPDLKQLAICLCIFKALIMVFLTQVSSEVAFAGTSVVVIFPI